MARKAFPVPLEPPADGMVAIIDTREQLGYTAEELAPLQVVSGTLTTGDVTLRGLEQQVAFEIKHSIEDLLGCIGRGRERFGRQMQRMLAYPTRGVVCEFTWADLERGDWRGQITPAQATGSILGWMATGIPFLFAGNRDAAARAVARLLYIAARRRWREARALLVEASNEVLQEESTEETVA